MEKKERSLDISRSILANLKQHLHQLNSTTTILSNNNLNLLIPSNNQRYLLYISTFQHTLYYYFYSIKDEYPCILNTDFCIKGKNKSPLPESIYYGVLFNNNNNIDCKQTFLISDILLLDSQVLDTLPFNQRYSTLLKFSTESTLFQGYLNSRLKIRLSPLFHTSKLSLHKTIFKFSNQCTHVLTTFNSFYKQNFSLDLIHHTSSFTIKSTDYGNIYDIYSITTREYIGKIYIPIDKQLHLHDDSQISCQFNTTFQKWTFLH